MKKFVAILLVALLACSVAYADTISFNGVVSASSQVKVFAAIGGTVDEVPAEAGTHVSADDVLAVLKTTPVYATADGNVTGIFGEPGDDSSVVVERYGAVMYIESNVKYTISASTDGAYNSTEMKFVHVGEPVYIQSRSDSDRTGTGVITSVEGTKYNVNVETGTFLLSETCYIYRDASYKNARKIGSGSISRNNPTAVTGSGSIAVINVADGASVKKGDVLFETMDGVFDGYYMSGKQVYAGTAGTVAQLNLEEGSQIQKNGVVAVIYPDQALRIEAQVNENDLGYVAVGDPVSIELSWNQDDDVTYEGTITMISALGETSQSDGCTYFKVYIDFTPDANTRYGMNAVVYTIDKDTAAEETDEGEKEPEQEETAQGTPAIPQFAGNKPDYGNGEKPEAPHFNGNTGD